MMHKRGTVRVDTLRVFSIHVNRFCLLLLLRIRTIWMARAKSFSAANLMCAMFIRSWVSISNPSALCFPTLLCVYGRPRFEEPGLNYNAVITRRHVGKTELH
ncbi:hypothetical protein FKM82_016254 [Ascaphus truei]